MKKFSTSDIKFLLNLVRYKLTGRRFPAHVAISVTNRCNLRCSYCFARYNNKDSDDITTERMLGLIDELANRGTRLINLTGGEPLIRKDIKKIIDYITITKGMKCSMSTNGHLLANNLKTIKNISSINISLDGNEKQHNRNRGPQDYNRVLSAIKLAIKNKIPVSTCTVLNRDNANCVDHVAHLAKEIGFLAIFHFPYGRLKPSENAAYHRIPAQKSAQILQKIIDYKNAEYPIYYSNKTHEYIRDWPFKRSSHILMRGDRKTHKNFKIIPCRAGDLYCFIDANGSVFPCTVLCGQVKAGNFLKDGFQGAWDKIPEYRCQACAFFFQNELNQLLSLDAAVWLNFVRTTRILK